MALAPSFYLPLRLQGLDTCLDLPPLASKKLLSIPSPERKHFSDLPILVVGFGQ
jgi:hypothetical protein